jgi:DNA polymerase-3 subunit gamma/tau
MFKNIIGQDNAIKLLISDVEKSTLNNSMIFHGEKYSGKLSAALEMLRVLNCLGGKEDSCTCINCMRINNLDFEGLIFLSRREFLFYLRELINAYKKTGKPQYLNNIIRTVKLAALPLQDFLVKEIFTEQEKRNLGELLEKLRDLIYKEDPKAKDLDSILEIIETLQNSYKKLNIPLDMLREMLDWTYINLPDINRVVIIDHVDHFEKGSQNILLKRLEEPSKNLFFILLAENKNKILPTIRSRCRTYYFRKLKKEHVDAVLKRDFEEQRTLYPSIFSFLKRNEETSQENILPILIKLFNLVFLKEAPFADLSIFLSAYSDKKLVKAMLYEIGFILESEILRREKQAVLKSDFKILEEISFINIVMLNNLIKDKYNDIDVFGLNPVLPLEGIFYPIKAMVQNDEI